MNQTKQYRGFSYLETLVAAAVLAIGFLALASATASGTSAMLSNEENARAAAAARQALEELENSDTPFEQLFAEYTTGLEIPDTDGRTKPLDRTWKVKGIASTGAATVRLDFPMSKTGQLDEAVAQRDLNGDGEITEGNRGADYKILPVTITVTWQGTSGPRTIEVQTLLHKTE